MPQVKQSVVYRMKGLYLARFYWRVNAVFTGIECADLRWEQWVKGTYTLTFRFGDDYIGDFGQITKRKNPARREIDGWYEDLQENQSPGPRPIKIGSAATCDDKVDCWYMFDDEPGAALNLLNDFEGRKSLLSVSWDAEFYHNFYEAGKVQKFHYKHFKLTGKCGDIDTRSLKPLP